LPIESVELKTCSFRSVSYFWLRTVVEFLM
jgi:hypothetical protein